MTNNGKTRRLCGSHRAGKTRLLLFLGDPNFVSKRRACWAIVGLLSLELTWLRGVHHLFVVDFMVFQGAYGLPRGHAIHFHVSSSV